MTLKTYRIELTDDAVQPITIPNGAQFLRAVREPDSYLHMYFLGDPQSDAATMVIEQVHGAQTLKEESVRHIDSVFGIWDSKFDTTHLFEVLP